MQGNFLLLVGVLGALLVDAATTSLDGIYSLVQRQIPQHQNSFTFALIEGDGDSFVISDTHGDSGGITIECTTVSACARGLYTYVTRYGGVDIWWTGSRLNQLASPLPSVGEPVNGSAIVEYRYHFNTVTFDYTAAFWAFDQWSSELDWLALRGVNLPLAWVGYEYILIEVFRDAGLTDAEIASFLSGSAFQAWNRFGNIQGSWGGDLPTQWVNDQFALNQQIVARMVELGMTPVLPAFTGFVPRAMARVYPNASIVNGSQWGGFPADLTDVSFLEPFDDLFATLQMSFISKQQAAYGNATHIYTLDQYNENSPYSGDTAYLYNISLYTFDSMRAADPEAVWMMQGWLFFADESFWTADRIAAYLGGVENNDDMIVLDLYSEAAPQWQRTNSYYGKQWIWCELHDYGGNMGFEGNLPVLSTDPLEALYSSGSSMKGMGLTMEGQEGNEIVYDFLLDQAWSPTSLDITSYVEAWVARRYPISNLPSAAQTAWGILSTTVYSNSNSDTQATIKSIFELAPSTSGLVNLTGHHPTEIPYNTNTTIVPALTNLTLAATQNPTLLTVPEFAYDLVDVVRQLLANRFIDAYEALITEYDSSSATAASVTSAGQPLLDILTILDTLLWTNENFLLSTWIADARALAGSNATYADYLEYNARNQITLWGPDGEINDYASKQWAGLVGTYYLDRWQTFITYLADIKHNGTAYDNTAIQAQLLDIGKEWDTQIWGQQAGESWDVVGDVMTVVNDIVQKWI
ncbi:glycoside hydrolase family 89 protein [Wolfiporia cocos MD-104 SS10]|uniref:Glycoside hydrolase family 89 protein n=1 Tax=Wolfiporia cocos (strain MD-104) TaxID=742152 RepID=A0A2H3J9R3_WOLCO|nr:glycoside hydrolase family 89 protein [Wolfiporia cocos MD-104 SS10]